MTELQSDLFQQPEAGAPRHEPSAPTGWKTALKTLLVLSARLLGMLLLLATAFRFYTDIQRDQVLHENLQLQRLLQTAEARMNLLALKVDSLQQSDRELRQLANMDPIPDEVREMEVGGTLFEPWPLRYEDLDLGLIDKLEREISFLASSMQDVRGEIELRIDELSHIPTIRPVNEGFISSGYGKRADPFTGRRRTHKGLDFQAPKGTAVYAPADGRVTQTGRVSGFGRVIKLDHGNGIVTLYGHLSTIRVRPGQNVSRGQRIGDVGSTGRSTSSHLHYEVRVNGRHTDPQDFILDELTEID